MIRIPPIAALRALDAAGRHLNFTRAAEELHVSQSAVSHQIRHIEELWGFNLFERTGRRIELTDQASQVIPVISRFLSDLEKTVSGLQDKSGDEGYIRVMITQSFALKWMVPRLGEFSSRFPDIDVTIYTIASTGEPNFENSDIAILYTDKAHPGLSIIPLLNDYSFPVCSPEFLTSQVKSLKKPADLLELPLLRRLTVDSAPRWRDWFSAAGVEAFSLPKGLHFPDSSMALQAAIDGQGVALGRSSHVSGDLSSGRLVKLFDVFVEGSASYHLLIPDARFEQPSVQEFIAWIKDEAVESQLLFDQQARSKGLTK